MPKQLSTAESMNVIITRKPLGLFYSFDEDAEVYIAIDNSTGEAWTEEFKEKEKCLEWLNE